MNSTACASYACLSGCRKRAAAAVARLASATTTDPVPRVEGPGAHEDKEMGRAPAHIEHKPHARAGSPTGEEAGAAIGCSMACQHTVHPLHRRWVIFLGGLVVVIVTPS